ncbi:MAG TPA: MgtC/SapB family protein [Longimicrobiales bacterium]
MAGVQGVAEWLGRVVEWLQGLEALRLDLLLRLLLAAVLGGVVGLEREISGKPAGFRTNLLICVGAALLTELSIGVAALADPLRTNADPARIAAQIVSGIGFLGAGTIIQARGSVVGLTTAATLWVVAAIGMAVGARAYVEAVGTTLLVIIALIALARVEEALVRRRLERRIIVTMDVAPGLLDAIRDAFQEAGFVVKLREVEREPDRVGASYDVSGPRNRWAAVLDRLIRTPGIRKVTQL